MLNNLEQFKFELSYVYWEIESTTKNDYDRNYVLWIFEHSVHAESCAAVINSD